MPEETKVEEERIDIPEKFLVQLKKINEKNLKEMQQFAGLSEHYFAIQRQIAQNVEGRIQNQKRFQTILEHAFKKSRLDNTKQNWNFDLNKGQFVCVKRPDVGPAIIKEGG